MSVKPERKHTTSVFMFQCEDVRVRTKTSSKFIMTKTTSEDTCTKRVSECLVTCRQTMFRRISHECCHKGERIPVSGKNLQLSHFTYTLKLCWFQHSTFWSSNPGLIAGHVGMKNLRNTATTSEPRQQKPAVDSVPRWTESDNGESVTGHIQLLYLYNIYYVSLFSIWFWLHL